VLVLLALLLSLDTARLLDALRRADAGLLALSLVLYIPHILTKALRWRYLLAQMGIPYGVRAAFWSYQGAIFLGLLTPGRLGEFARAAHITQDCNVSTGRALSSVLLDRLFDLAALVSVGGLALLALGSGQLLLIAVVAGLLLIALASLIILRDTSFRWLQSLLLKTGRPGELLIGDESWFVQIRESLLLLSPGALLIAGLMTAVGYGLFFLQTYLAALAFHLPVDIIVSSYATALGSLVALIPVSVSGLGTRDAAIATYLGTQGITLAQSISFSLSIFLVFYVGGGLFGFIAWQIKPVDLQQTASDTAD
jgi:hypothetical protein